MANQFVNIDGKKLGVWFQHVQITDEEKQNILFESWQNAEDLGQIKCHAQDEFGDNIQFITAVTRCQLEDENRNVVSVGYAFCSIDDNFCKAKGRNVSLSRAIQWAKRSK